MPTAKATTDADGIDFGSAPDEDRAAGSRPKWQYAVAGTSILLVGMIGGMYLMRDGTTPEPESEGAAVTGVLQTAAMGEKRLLAGNPKQAMEFYRQAMQTAGSPTGSLVYRMGVCSEQLGELDNALVYYKQAAELSSAEISLVAQLGQARIHFRKGQFELATKTLAPIASVSASPVVASTRIGTEVDYHMALLQSASVLGELPKSQLNLGHVFHPRISFQADQLLELVPLEGNQLARRTPIGDDTRFGIQIHGPARSPATTLISAGIQNQPVSVVLEALGAATTWKISLTRVANEMVSARLVDVQLRDKTAAELLSNLLAPQRLFWILDGDTLVIDRIDNVSPEMVVARQRKRANELLISTLAEAPNHSMAPQAYLALGNLAFSDGRPERAATFYGEIVERFANHVIAQTATFNRSKLSYLNGDLAAATEGFYNVVDERRGTALEPLAYLYLGRLLVEQGDSKAAKKEFSRSLSLGTQPEITATAALSLASVYLMNRESGAAGSANSVLMEAREPLQNAPFRNQAVFLSALTRFRTALGVKEKRRLGRELIAAAARVEPDGFFGDFGYLLIGDAFAEVNIPMETIRLYQAGLSRPLASTLRDELLFRLASEYRKQNKHQLAKEALLELTAGGSAYWAPKAGIELAELLVQSSKYEECIRHCRWSLVQEYPQQTKVDLLRLLGRVYEELGEHEQAGICFAGFLPSEIPKIAEARR